MEALTLNNYSRASMATMLSALPREEQQWTRNFLDSIILMPSLRTKKTQHANHVAEETNRQACLNRLCGVLQDDGVPYDVTRNEIMEERYGKL